MGFLDKFKRKASENKTARVSLQERLQKKISPETRAKIKKGAREVGKYMREMQESTPRVENEMWRGIGDQESRRRARPQSDYDVFGGGESLLGGSDYFGGSAPPKRKGKSSEWDWMK